jgi:hypothetical protein
MSGHGYAFDQMVRDDAQDADYRAEVRAEREERAAEERAEQQIARTANSLRLDLSHRIAGVKTIGDDTLLADIIEMHERERRVDAGHECPRCAGTTDIVREQSGAGLRFDIFACYAPGCRTPRDGQCTWSAPEKA